MKNLVTANRLSLALYNAGMRPQELADRSGVSKASISQYLSGTHAPSNLSAGKMAEVLGVSPVWLMGFDVDMTSGNSTQKSAADLMREYYEKEMLEKYRALDPYDKGRVDQLIDDLLEKKTKRMEGDINVG